MQILDSVTQQFITALQQDMNIIQTASETLFYYLVVIQISLSAIWMTIAGESLQNFITKLIQLFFSFGFFYTLIKFGGDWMPNVLNGFIEIGQKTGIQSLSPSSIIEQGMSISNSIFHAFFNWGLLTHPFVSIIGAIICISILVLYGLIAAELVIVLVKSYILISIGGLFFAFGASDYTREMTKNYFKASIGLGLNLMSLYLLLGVGQNIGEEWASLTSKAASNHELMPMFMILSAVIVYYMILKNIPSFIASLSGISGFRNYGSSTVAMAINAGISGANTLTGSARLMGGGTQAIGQLGVAGGHLGKSFAQGMQTNTSPTMKLKEGALNMGKNAALSTGSAFKDFALKQNQKLTMGQKFNKHLANRVKK